MSEWVNKIHCGHVLDVLRQMPSNFVDCVVTSPPYYSLRDYRTEDQIWDAKEGCVHEWNVIKHPAKGGHTKPDNMPNVGSNRSEQIDGISARFGYESSKCMKCSAWRGSLGQEPIHTLFIKHLCDIFDEVKRVLKDSGSCWVNLGDSYNGSGGDHKEWHKLTSDKGFQHELSILHGGIGTRDDNMLNKCLMLIPQRFVIEMVSRGWILRNYIIWEKGNPMPSSSKDRMTNSYEPVMFFTKKERYFFEQQLEPLSSVTIDDIQKRKNLACLTGEKGSKHYNNEQSVYDKQKTGRLRTEFVGSGIIDTEDVPYSVQPRDKDFVEVRNLPDIEKFGVWLNSHRKSAGLSIDAVEAMFGNQASHHWFSMECFPSKDDFLKLKSILSLPDDYDKAMTEIFYKSSEKTTVSDFGRNMRDVWKINTQPLKELHFASFPEKLVKRCLDAGCPKYVCNKCGKPREKVFEQKIDFGYKDSETKYGESNAGNLAMKRQAYCDLGFESPPLPVFKGYSDCGCGAEFSGGIVLDVFCGSGTVPLVALKQGKRFVGIELNPEYVKIANRRIDEPLHTKGLSSFIKPKGLADFVKK